MALLNPLDVLKNPKSRADIQKAVDYQTRLAFHAEICVDRKDSQYCQAFLKWVNSFVTAKDKQKIFDAMLTFPLKTNEIVDAISDEYQKVFKAQNAFNQINFSSQELNSDFNEFIEKLEICDFFESEGFNTMMSRPSSILVVDLPQIQQSKRPEPYYYLVDVSKLVDVGFNKNGDIKYVAFIDGEKNILIDDTFYRLYQKINEEFILISESVHDLGFCPARSFWGDMLNKSNKLIRQSPISGVISRLDWLLFFETAKQGLDLYGAYPVYWSLASKCDYSDENGNYCEGGKISYFDNDLQTQKFRKCPKCEASSLVAPGSHIEKPIPMGDNKIESGAPMGVVTIDRNSLDYNVDEVERLKAEIVQSATGKLKLINKEAINQDQVNAQFENQTNVLNWIARNLEHTHEWLISTICQLRYGDLFLNCELSYGTRFYLESPSDTINDFKVSKDAGMPSYILLDRLISIEDSQTRGNDTARERLRILRNLEPYPEMSLADCKNNGIDVADKEGFVLKCNFANFVSKFEREYGSIIEFGSLLPFSKKIDTILTQLQSYAGTKLNTSTPAA